MWRLQNGELDGVKSETNRPPRAPTMSVTSRATKRRPSNMPEHQGHRQCLFGRKAPRATIILMAIFPRNDKSCRCSHDHRINKSNL
jgi:hypothetical protein